jgi:hypothetical protein
LEDPFPFFFRALPPPPEGELRLFDDDEEALRLDALALPRVDALDLVPELLLPELLLPELCALLRVLCALPPDRVDLLADLPFDALPFLAPLERLLADRWPELLALAPLELRDVCFFLLLLVWAIHPSLGSLPCLRKPYPDKAVQNAFGVLLQDGARGRSRR